MANSRDDHEDDFDAYDDDAPQQRDRSGSASSGNGRKDFGQTSDLGKTPAKEEGSFFGMDVSPELAEKGRIAYNLGLDWFTRKGEKAIIPVAKRFAENVLKASPAEAMHFAGKWANIGGYLIIGSQPLTEEFHNLKKTVTGLNDIFAAVQPLAKYGKGIGSLGPLSSDNEVIKTALSTVIGKSGYDTLQTLVRAIGVAPALYAKVNRHQAANHELEKQLRFEQAKNAPDPKKALAEFYKEEFGLSKAITISGNETQAWDRIIDENRKEYLEKFKVFERDNKKDIGKEIDELLSFNADNAESQIPVLRRYGVHTDSLKRAVDMTDEAQKSTALGKAKTQVESQLKRVKENAVKAKFVRQNGAFDHDWLEHYTFGQERSYASRNQQAPQTHLEELKEKFKKFEEARTKVQEDIKLDGKSFDKDGKAGEFGTAGAGLISAIVGEVGSKALFGEKAKEKYTQQIALYRILHLRRVLEKAKDMPPSQVPSIVPTGKNKEDDMGYAQYIHAIFEQNRKDQNNRGFLRPKIDDQLVEHLEKARLSHDDIQQLKLSPDEERLARRPWSDAAIQKLSDDELNPYEYAIKIISKRIQDGRMDSIALIDLVGDVHRRIVHTDGHTFGPGVNGKDEKVAKEAILKLIDEKTALLNTGAEQTNEQVNDKLGAFRFSVDDLKQALQSDVMGKDERAFIFTLFSDVVGSDEKLCGKLGISNERCKELRQESIDHFTSTLDAGVKALSDIIENEPKKLEKYLKLTDKEKEQVLSL
jgi:hypothetical protein